MWKPEKVSHSTIDIIGSWLWVVIACVSSTHHSLAIVKQQGLKRADWDELLDWMVEEQGMDELEAPDREIILDYLETNFNVDRKLK